jgi:hypothetical protein
MAQPTIQPSFNSGEWSPNLYGRVDIEKFHSGAAVLRNFYIDYRGGVSSRTGTKYCLRGYKDSTAIRMIPFQATFSLGYALEFGDFYIRFYRNGAPVLETAKTITAAAAGPPEVFTSAAHGYANNDWIFAGNKYYIVQNVTTNTFTLTDLFGTAIATNPFTLPASAQRVYTLVSPYAAADLALLKYAQNVTNLIICHPNYQPYVLTYASATSWAITAITFGTTIAAPTGVSVGTTLTSGTTYYSYLVTAVDANGQESLPSSAASLNGYANFSLVAGTNTIAWAGVTGAASYRVYRTNNTQYNPVPAGVPYGFIGSTTSTTMADTNITPDFSQSPPIERNPFATGSGVQSVTIGTPGSYTTAPTTTFSAGISHTATGFPVLTAATITLSAAGSGYVVGDIVVLANGIIIQVLTVTTGAIATFAIINRGSATTLPANPVAQSSTSGTGTGATFTVNWGVQSITITDPGEYSVAPTITFSAGAAAGTPILGATGNGNPSVPAFFQQRLVLAATNSAPQTLYMSQTGNYYNFNVSSPIRASDAITASIISGQLNTIKAMVQQPAGLIVLTDGSSWLLNGGSFGAAVTPSSLVANAQSFNGSSDVPPIVVVFDMLYVQSKGSVVRDSLYNFYANVYTGTDITIIPSHLFYGFQVTEWAWAEEPFKLVYATRNDGTLLTLTFMKEQDFVAWSHHDTNGAFDSVCTTIETVAQGSINAVYTVVSRVVNGVTVKYIERFAERYMTNGVADA